MDKHIEITFADNPHRTLWIIVLISFICSIPFDIFMIRSDWEKINCIELLEQRNPAGYQKWLAETNYGYYNSESYRDPYMKDFAKPIHHVSFYLGLPFFMIAASVIYFAYLLCYGFMLLPKVLKLLVCFFIYLWGLLKLVEICAWIKWKLKPR